jgi:lipoprotein NlpI/transglutaminase-like putative cysteine protease
LVNDLRVGDTLELAYTREGQNPVFGNKFIDFAGWDQSYPSLHRRVALTYPADRKIAWKVRGGVPTSKVLAPIETVRDGKRRLLFEEQWLSRVQPEPFTPPDHNPYRALHFSEFTGWDDVVSWAETLFQSQGEPSDELRTLIDSLRAKATDAERVAAALEFVQTEIRYFSVSLGESSHRPTPPSIVLKRRYGDCKDKSLLLITLLRALGIESSPVLLAINYGRGLDTALPSPLLFNHAIVQVRLGDQVYYLDPTRLGQRGPLERMGEVHVHAQVLPIAPGTRGLVTIPNKPRGLYSEVIERATLPTLAGDGTLVVQQIWRGVGAESTRVSLQHVPREQISKSYDDAMERRYPGAKRVGEIRFDDNAESNIVTALVTYAIPKMATERKGNWFIRFMPSNQKGVLAPRPPAGRVAPLRQPTFPYAAEYTFEVKLPSTISVMADPSATTIRNDAFSYTRAVHFRGNVSKTRIKLRVTADRVEPKDFKKYDDDLRALADASINVVVIPKAAIKSGPAAKKDLPTILRDRLHDTVAKTTQSIKSGKLAGADLAGAYCLRSAAHADLGSASAAIADADKALKLTPQSPDTLYCRGYAYFSAGDFEKAIADYSKALALGPVDGTFQQRGVARFFAGQLEAAAQDFAKAAELSTQEPQIASDLWLTWAYQRLGKALPDDLVKRAAEQPLGAWPRPALAVMTGKLAPGELLKLIERKGGDEGRLDACEGYFYLGEYYLGRGETAKARELFQKAQQTNVIMYIEYKAAGFELRKIPAPAEGKVVGEPTPAPARRAKAGKAKRAAPSSGAADWKSGAFAQ